MHVDPLNFPSAERFSYLLDVLNNGSATDGVKHAETDQERYEIGSGNISQFSLVAKYVYFDLLKREVMGSCFFPANPQLISLCMEGSECCAIKSFILYVCIKALMCS